MAMKQPIKTTTNTAQLNQLNLPVPQTFDILPPIHELLARVEAHQNQTTIPGSVDEHEAFEDGAIDIGSAYLDIQPLSPKELSTAALDIKGRIRNALRELEKLPDMDRTVHEQEEEIAELNAKIAKQREVLQNLAKMAQTMQDKMP